MKLKDAMELQALLDADSKYTNPTTWNHGDGYQVETTRADGAKVTAKVSGDELIVEVSNHQINENKMTTKHTHTGGPWYAVKLEASPDHAWAIDGELVEIARLSEWPDHMEETEANARLIAAAPELLDALRRLTHPMANDEDLTNALAVIAKVEGGDA